MEQEGEIEVPETDNDGKIIFNMREEEVEDTQTKKKTKVTIKEPRMKKVPKMVNKKGKVKRQNPVTGKMETVEVPMQEDLAPRIYRVSMTLGEEQMNRFLCKKCLQKKIDVLKTAWDELERIHN